MLMKINGDTLLMQTRLSGLKGFEKFVREVHRTLLAPPKSCPTIDAYRSLLHRLKTVKSPRGYATLVRCMQNEILSAMDGLSSGLSAASLSFSMTEKVLDALTEDIEKLSEAIDSVHAVGIEQSAVTAEKKKMDSAMLQARESMNALRNFHGKKWGTVRAPIIPIFDFIFGINFSRLASSFDSVHVSGYDILLNQLLLGIDTRHLPKDLSLSEARSQYLTEINAKQKQNLILLSAQSRMHALTGKSVRWWWLMSDSDVNELKQCGISTIHDWGFIEC